MSKASEQTQFKPGNQAWRARSSHGRKPKFASADELESACFEYLQWAEDNPLITIELVKYQGEAQRVEVPKMRAVTIAGLCNFLDITHETWTKYRERSDLSEVTSRIDSIIYQMKFEGAAADMLNANIISRELGLADKQDVQSRGGLIIEPVYVKPEIAGDILYKKPAASLPDNGR